MENKRGPTGCAFFCVHNAELKGVSLWWKLIGELYKEQSGVLTWR